nr:MAG TPA: hypothetical protein [Caudoviricetes sp.]
MEDNRIEKMKQNNSRPPPAVFLIQKITSYRKEKL